MKNVVFCLLIGIQPGLVSLATAQTRPVVLGQVRDAATNEPVPFATVYVNASTLGTTAGADGNYQLSGLPAGTIELVSSAVGYTTVRQSMRLGNGQNRRVTFLLVPNAKALQTVTVRAKRTNEYDRLLKQFKRELLGDTPFADRCQIVNLETVSLSLDKGRLVAQAGEPLVIENKALGYRLHYNLSYFDSYRRATHYAGTSRFEVLTPDNAEQAVRWERNRQRAYRGSLRHLLASLCAGTHEGAGFLVYTAAFDAPADPAGPIAQIAGERPTAIVRSDSLVKPAQLPSERQFFSAKPLEVFYTRQSAVSPYRDMPYLYSVVYMPKGKAAIITTDGWIAQPNGMEVRGALSDDRLASLLPVDWQPAGPTDNSIGTTPDEGTVLPTDTLAGALVAGWSVGQKGSAPAVFLHTDKVVYTTGDQLWYSGYVLHPTTHQPLTATEPGGETALHVELVAPDGRPQHQWARVQEGRTAGSFRLSDSLATGVYGLRAYAETDHPNSRPAFERKLLIVSGLSAGADPNPSVLPTVADDPDVQFLPEGGRWVAGLSARLGIKAVTQRGRGIPAAGRILSAAGAELGRFQTDSRGLGSLELVPQPGQTYTAEVATASGLVRIALPAVEPEGLVLAVDGVSDSTQLTVRVQASASLASQPVYLMVQSRGQLIQQTKIQLLHGKARLTLPVAKLPAGLVQLTLFDALTRPRAERLVFIADLLAPVQTEIITAKSTYQPREWVTLSLRVADGDEPLSLIGSVAVTDAGQVAVDTGAADIRTHLLLTGDLRGRVEHPAYYLSSNQPAVRRSLDNLLLTQGWRRLNWRFRADPPFPPDSATGMRLSGRVLDKKGKAVPEANVLLTFFGRSGASFARSARSDQRGRFVMDELLLTDTITVRTRTMTTNFKPIPSAHVELDPPGGYFPAPDSGEIADLGPLKPFIAAGRQRQATAPDEYRDRSARLLQEVTVRAARPNGRENLYTNVDYTVLFDEKSRDYGNAYEMMANRVPGVQVMHQVMTGGYLVKMRGLGSFSPKGGVSPLYRLDGSYLTENEYGTVLLMLNPADIERIEVVKGGGGTLNGAGVIAFYTKKWKTDDATATGPGESVLTLYGYPTSREFYTPRHEEQTDSLSHQPDRRDVLYWKPLLATDGQGLTTFRFPLSDVARTVRITMQGVTPYGRPVYISRLLKVR